MTRPITPELEAVTFDFWNTLIQEDNDVHNKRVDAWLGLLQGEGMAVRRQRLGDAFNRSWLHFQKAWRANLRYDAFDAVRDALEHLDMHPPADMIDELVSVVTDPDASWHPEPTPHVTEALNALKARGIKMAVLCDVGLTPSRTLRTYLHNHEMLKFFEHFSFSDEVGVFKPDQRIFSHALEGLSVSPEAAAHVGDLKRTDMAGAKEMGMFAVRYTGVSDDAATIPGHDPDTSGDVEGDEVISDHRDLLMALGLE